jgi:mannose-6-phosphate isomerase-like protein (cupin superfamily)
MYQNNQNPNYNDGQNWYHSYPTMNWSYLPVYNPYATYQDSNEKYRHTDPFISNQTMNSQPNQYLQPMSQGSDADIQDYGPAPFAVNINEITKLNTMFRSTLWTGEHFQLTLMSLNPGEDIGLEVHPNHDQFIRIEEGEGRVQMGNSEDALDYVVDVQDNYAFIIPAGKYHNLVNTGDIPLKLYSIYAPVQHPKGTIHETKEDAMAAEETHKE